MYNFFLSFQIKIKCFVVLAALRRNVKRVGGAHIRVIALRQLSFFRRDVAAVARCWQFGVRFDRPEVPTPHSAIRLVVEFLL